MPTAHPRRPTLPRVFLPVSRERTLLSCPLSWDRISPTAGGQMGLCDPTVILQPRRAGGILPQAVQLTISTYPSRPNLMVTSSRKPSFLWQLGFFGRKYQKPNSKEIVKTENLLAACRVIPGDLGRVRGSWASGTQTLPGITLHVAFFACWCCSLNPASSKVGNVAASSPHFIHLTASLPGRSCLCFLNFNLKSPGEEPGQSAMARAAVHVP